MYKKRFIKKFTIIKQLLVIGSYVNAFIEDIPIYLELVHAEYKFSLPCNLAGIKKLAM
jgi:hypothetical protein